MIYLVIEWQGYFVRGAFKTEKAADNFMRKNRHRMDLVKSEIELQD